MKSQGLKVFLSYAEPDDKSARVLRTELEKGGFEVWDPAARLTPGDNWALELRPRRAPGFVTEHAR